MSDTVFIAYVTSCIKYAKWIWAVEFYLEVHSIDFSNGNDPLPFGGNECGPSNLTMFSINFELLSFSDTSFIFQAFCFQSFDVVIEDMDPIMFKT